ncbi:MAG TPA: hypothetical protein VL984_16895 [Acidimicrobiales bacterium]|nr:hypothetical protein [Acidimicrobiales bacterium]
MAASTALEHLRVGWWAGQEPSGPLETLTGGLLRAEVTSRCQWLRPVLVYGTPASWAEPGFTGEPVAVQAIDEWSGPLASSFDILVASGSPEPGGAKLAHALSEDGTGTVAVAPEEAWGLLPSASVGAPFGVPQPSVLAPRHFPPKLLEARRSYLRVVEGLPAQYVLVEGALLEGGEPALGSDLEMALEQLSEKAGGDKPAEVVRLAPGPLGEDPEVEAVLRQRRAEAEEGRYLAEDWPGYRDRPRLPLRVTSPVDLAAAVSGAAAVLATSGALMALCWALGVPHVAIAPEESAATDFSAWTGDTSAVVEQPAELVATMGNIFARRGRPPGLRRLEATVDQSLDEAASNLEKAATEAAGRGRGHLGRVSPEERIHELETVNESLRLRLAAERLRFGERSALLEKAAGTTVESAIKAVHGQDVIVRRRLQETEREMRRLQEETAVQQAELRAIHASPAMRALTSARGWYERRWKATR